MELSIALERPCYFPGEILRCMIKVRRSGDAAATAAIGNSEQLQLSFECSGTERVDPSWVSRLYRPEVTATKDSKVNLGAVTPYCSDERLVRSIFSTGQVPLLGHEDTQALRQGRDFVVRCRLPNKMPPSYRGTAVRFLYQVQAKATLVPNLQQQQQQQPISCQAQCSFVVWPLPDRGSSSSNLERRGTLPSTHSQNGSGAAGTAAGGGAAAAADGLADTEMIDYKLGTHVTKLRWEELIQNVVGTRTLLPHQPSTQHMYPTLTTRSSTISSSLTSRVLTAQLSALDSLMLDDQTVAAAAAAAAEDAESDNDQNNNPLRHLTPAQRASMAVRTFNLRAGEYPLLRLVMQPPQDGLLQPGGSFGLLLDFREAHGASPGTQPVCLQVTALLETEEVVIAPHAHTKTSDSPAMRKLYAEQLEVTAHLLTSHFVFSIPLTAPPSFKTPMICHRWVLRFELIVGKPKVYKPTELVTEQLLWSLPLVVYPPGAWQAAANG